MLHTGDGLQPRCHCVDIASHLSFLEQAEFLHRLGSRHPQKEGQQVIGTEAGILAEQIPETLEEQAGARQQNDGE